MLFLLLGPSGVGKGTQISLLQERHPEYVFPKSVTTRKMRPGESEGKPYYFISDEQFDDYITKKAFLEWAEVHQAARYGTLLAPIKEAIDEEKVVIKELDIQGLINIQSTIEKDGYEQIKANLRSIFIMPPSIETLRKRITERAPIKEVELQARLESADKEIRQAGICSSIIETSEEDDIETVYDKLTACIEEHQNRPHIGTI